MIDLSCSPKLCLEEIWFSYNKASLREDGGEEVWIKTYYFWWANPWPLDSHGSLRLESEVSEYSERMERMAVLPLDDGEEKVIPPKIAFCLGGLEVDEMSSNSSKLRELCFDNMCISLPLTPSFDRKVATSYIKLQELK